MTDGLFDKYDCGIKIKKDLTNDEKTLALINLLKEMSNDDDLHNMIGLLEKVDTDLNINEAIKDCLNVLQKGTERNLKWEMIDGDLVLHRISLGVAVKTEFDHCFEKQCEALSSAYNLFPFSQHVITSWIKKHNKDPYEHMTTLGHDSFNWANGSVQGLLISLNLGEEDQVKDALNHFNDIRKMNGVELKLKETDQIFDGSGMEYEYEWLDNPKIPVTLRIWIQGSKVCKRVEDGTQPKYKIVCEEAQ